MDSLHFLRRLLRLVERHAPDDRREGGDARLRPAAAGDLRPAGEPRAGAGGEGGVREDDWLLRNLHRLDRLSAVHTAEFRRGGGTTPVPTCAAVDAGAGGVFGGRWARRSNVMHSPLRV